MVSRPIVGTSDETYRVFVYEAAVSENAGKRDIIMTKHSKLFRLLILLTVALGLAFPVAGGTNDVHRRAAAPAPAPVAKQAFSPMEQEAFLPQDAISYIRPGLKIIVNSVTIRRNRIPMVDASSPDGL